MQPPWTFDPALDRGGHDLPDDGYAAIVGAALARSGTCWQVVVDGAFLKAEPLGRPRPAQGWKLHCSATVLSAPFVLRATLPALLGSATAFKLCRSPRVLARFTAPDTPVDAAGKFLTIYPEDDAAAVRLAERLLTATRGLAGQRIYTDRPLRIPGIVFARYGAFDGARAVFDRCGVLRGAIQAPDGALIPDAREPGAYAPPWATDPFPPVPVAGAPQSVVTLGETTLVSVIRRANGGGVYRGTRAGRPVVVKEARPHVAVDRWGRDLRDRRRHEHAVLARLEGLRVTPAPIELIERDDHLFLVMEDLGRIGLRQTAATHRGSREWLRATAGSIAEAIGRCHDAGVIVRDLHPGNVMLDGAGAPRLVDVEIGWFAGGDEPWFSGATLAYASPAAEAHARPCVEDDVYGLGATLFALVTGVDPLFIPDADGARGVAEKAAGMLAWFDADPWARELIPACLSAEAGQRPSVARIVEVIRRPVAAVAPAPARAVEQREERVDRAIEGLAGYLRASIGAYAHGGLWPITRAGWLNDPHCVATGTAGAGIALCALARAGCRVGDLIEAAVAAVTRVLAVPGRPVGLCSGEAGFAWFLADAAAALGDQRPLSRAVELVAAADHSTARMDLADGLAGLLLAASRLYRLTGEPALRRVAEACAARLEAARTETPFGPGWVLPASATPDGRDKIYPGYATGAVGIAVSLLFAGTTFGEAGWRETGTGTLDGMLARFPPGGPPVWPPSNHASRPSAFWEKGMAGVGAGFARAAVITGERSYREAAIQCVELVRPVSPASYVTLFHGLAGIGEFLLDIELLLGERGGRAELDRIVDLVLEQAIDYRARGWGICFPDEEGLAAADFGLGSAGVAAWLARYRWGGPRALHPDENGAAARERGAGAGRAGRGPTELSFDDP